MYSFSLSIGFPVPCLLLPLFTNSKPSLCVTYLKLDLVAPSLLGLI